MFLRLFAIAVFILITGPAIPVQANDFAKRFIAVSPKPLPPFIFTDKEGRTHDLKEYKGRFVLLNLWATWCLPCANEMPSLNELQNEFDYRLLNIVALNEDHNGVTAAQSFYTRHSLTHLPIYVDSSGQVPSLTHTHGLPTTFLINPDGLVLGYVEGEANWSDPDTVAFLRSKIVLTTVY